MMGKMAFLHLARVLVPR